MSCFKVAVATAAALAASIVSVRAADMPRYRTDLPYPRSEEKPLRVDEFVSGWYLRGDLGYRFQRLGGMSDTVNGEFASKTFQNAGVLGLGGGYKWRWVRLDMTGDYGWRSRATGTNNNGLTSVSTKFDGYTVLVNGYIDLGTWGGFTPYVGAGIGGAYVTLSGYETNPASLTTTPSNSRWNLAWAAMAGVGYNISHNVLIDLGYRHVALGSITGGPALNPVTLKKVSGDEVRLGLRFLLD